MKEQGAKEIPIDEYKMKDEDKFKRDNLDELLKGGPGW